MIIEQLHTVKISSEIHYMTFNSLFLLLGIATYIRKMTAQQYTLYN